MLLGQFFRIPKIQIILILLLICSTTISQNPIYSTVLLLFFSLASAVLSDFLFLTIRKKQLFFPSAAIVSGLIIALLTAPNLPWYESVIASTLAMFAKNFLRVSERHIFNPAAIGLFVAAMFFNHNVSWWGVSFQEFTLENIQSILLFGIILIPFLVSAIRLKKYYIQFAFLSTHTIAFVLMNMYFGVSFLLLPPFILDPTTLFFTGVMLTEPMTSPNKPSLQIAFGITVALISILTVLPLFKNIADPFIFSLLIGNLLFVKFR